MVDAESKGQRGFATKTFFFRKTFRLRLLSLRRLRRLNLNVRANSATRLATNHMGRTWEDNVAKKFEKKLKKNLEDENGKKNLGEKTFPKMKRKEQVWA